MPSPCHRTFKAYYAEQVQVHLTKEFPHLVSYSCFVALIPDMMIPMLAYLQSRYGACTGISFIDATSLSVCDPKRISGHRVFAVDARRGKTSMGWFFVLCVAVYTAHRRYHNTLIFTGKHACSCGLPTGMTDSEKCFRLRCSYSPPPLIFDQCKKLTTFGKWVHLALSKLPYSLLLERGGEAMQAILNELYFWWIFTRPFACNFSYVDHQ